MPDLQSNQVNLTKEDSTESTSEETKSVYRASEQFYNAAKAEYDYESNRNSTLDNKVSMTLAFCGVVFLLLIGYLDILAIWKTGEVNRCWQCIFKFLSSTLQIVCLACFAVCVIKLFLILRPKTYCRLDANFLIKETLPEWEEKQAYMYLGVRYTKFTEFNRNVNEARSKEYSCSVKWLLFAMLFCVINEIIKFNIL